MLIVKSFELLNLTQERFILVFLCIIDLLHESCYFKLGLQELLLEGLDVFLVLGLAFLVGSYSTACFRVDADGSDQPLRMRQFRKELTRALAKVLDLKDQGFLLKWI